MIIWCSSSSALSSCCYILPTPATTPTICLHLCKCNEDVHVCVGEGWAQGSAPGCSATRQLPSEVRASNAAQPLRRISWHHGGRRQRRTLGRGAVVRKVAHCEPHIHAHAPRSDSIWNFCPYTYKNSFNHLEQFYSLQCNLHTRDLI